MRNLRFGMETLNARGEGVFRVFPLFDTDVISTIYAAHGTAERTFLNTSCHLVCFLRATNMNIECAFEGAVLEEGLRCVQLVCRVTGGMGCMTWGLGSTLQYTSRLVS